MKKSVKYLLISGMFLVILASGFLYIHFQRLNNLPIYQVENNVGEEFGGGHVYRVHYARFKNHLYKSVNPFIYKDEYPLGKQIGRTQYKTESIFSVKGHKDWIALRGYMVPTTYFKETSERDNE
ncbi:hypothetical protein [Falsibacillus pallidus]|uniref:hypothetical protein n=1 Tax=Falsibacillus pallidus TaxID=493781 RepID=UPI003D99192E